MKKQPIYLYVLGALSLISTLLKLPNVFATQFPEIPYESTGDAQADAAIKASQEFVKGSFTIQTNMISKFLVLVMLALLIAVAVFLFKKQYETAGWIYVGYLGTTLLYQLYTFLASRHLLDLYTDETMRSVASTSLLVGFGIQLLIFAVYLGITLFNLLRKPKVSRVDSTAGTI
ncbi:ABC transporter permease [Streptococcus moroccensis]|uniref:Major facilitator superfamily permease n=1 Tax=Streptococcus moroccensis TaxID=1451356 RepID=A0ABT9YRF5_9STRE|nr:hypothetical protein [Streptococcus moroccensis]MDQ0222578.1 hypothetical protein [Streptococcus moroccensis]